MRTLNITVLAILIIFVFTTISGCSKAGSLTVENAWVRAASNTAMGEADQQQAHSGTMPAGVNSAAYMLIRNETQQDDRLLGVECDAARIVELHETSVQGDMMQMRMVGAIDIPAGSTVELKPGGLHVMLIDLQRELEPGSSLLLMLIFEKAGRVSVEAEIRSP